MDTWGLQKPNFGEVKLIVLVNETLRLVNVGADTTMGGSVHAPNRTWHGGSIRKLKTIASSIIKFEFETVGLVDSN